MLKDVVLSVGAGLAAGELLLGLHWLWSKRHRLQQADLANLAAIRRRIRGA